MRQVSTRCIDTLKLASFEKNVKCKRTYEQRCRESEKINEEVWLLISLAYFIIAAIAWPYRKRRGETATARTASGWRHATGRQSIPRGCVSVGRSKTSLGKGNGKAPPPHPTPLPPPPPYFLLTQQEKCCVQFQTMEEERLVYLRNIMWLYTNILSSACISDDEVWLCGEFFFCFF